MSNLAITWAYEQKITSGPKFVLLALADMADEDHSCYPGQEKLAKMTGQGVRTVRRSLLELEMAGFLSRRRRFDAAGHRTSDRYVLPVGQKIPTGQIGQRPNQPEANVASGQTGHRPETTSLPAKFDSPTGQIGQVSLSEPLEEPKESSSAKTKFNYPPVFEEFWAAYPRHVGKGGAFKTWKTAQRKADAMTIIAGADRYRLDPNREDEYTAHPSSWLNDCRWDDEPLPKRGASKTALAVDNSWMSA